MSVNPGGQINPNFEAQSLAQNEAVPLKQTGSVNAPFSNSGKQAGAAFYMMIIALQNSFITGSKGMMARAQVGNFLNSRMLQINARNTSDPLIQISPSMDHNSAWITSQQDINRQKMQKQSQNNQAAGILQQDVTNQGTQADTMGQSVTQVLQQVTAQLQTLLQISYSANLTKPPST